MFAEKSQLTLLMPKFIQNFLKEIIAEYESIEHTVCNINLDNVNIFNTTRYNCQDIKTAIARVMVLNNAYRRVLDRKYNKTEISMYESMYGVSSFMGLIEIIQHKLDSYTDSSSHVFAMSNDASMYEMVEALRMMGSVKPGTPQYDAAISTLAEAGKFVSWDRANQVKRNNIVRPIYWSVEHYNRMYQYAMHNGRAEFKSYKLSHEVPAFDFTIKHVTSSCQANPPSRRRHRLAQVRGDNYKLEFMKLIKNEHTCNPNLVVRSTQSDSEVTIAVSNVKNLIDKNNVLEELLFRENSFEISHMDSLAILSECLYAMSSYTIDEQSHSTKPAKLFVYNDVEVLSLLFHLAHPTFKIGILPKNKMSASTNKALAKAVEEKLDARLEHIRRHTGNLYSALTNNSWPAKNAVTDVQMRVRNAAFHFDVLSKNFDLVIEDGSSDIFSDSTTKKSSFADMTNKTNALLREYETKIEAFNEECRLIAEKVRRLWALDKTNFMFREHDAETIAEVEHAQEDAENAKSEEEEN